MDGTNYKNAMARHRPEPDRALIRDRLAALRDAGVVYYRDGGDILGASAYAREVAGEYGIEYRSCVFATHNRKQYGWSVGHAFDGPAEFRALVERAKE